MRVSNVLLVCLAVVAMAEVSESNIKMLTNNMHRDRVKETSGDKERARERKRK